MRQKLIAFGDDYWIENAQGSRFFFVDGKDFGELLHLAFQGIQGKQEL